MAETAKSAFASVDTAGVGKVETSSLPLLLSALNAPLTVPMDDLLALLDRTGTGLIFSDDFINWYTSMTSGPSIDDLSVGASSTSTNLNDLTADQLFNKVEQVARLANKTSSSDIHEAAWNNDFNLVKRYISIDSSLANSIDDTEFGSSYRPLHYASYNGHYEICKLLLNNPVVDINAKTETGCTPLFLSAQQGHSNVVKLLLENGADVSIMEDEEHYTAVDVSRCFRSSIFEQIFKNGEEWEYENWRKVPGKIGGGKVGRVKGNSFDFFLPVIEDAGALKLSRSERDEN